MRQRFEARKGSHTVTFWAENWHDALASFELAFTGPDPTEESAHRAAAYDIVETSAVPETISEFLKQTTNEGNRMSKENVPQEVRDYMSELGKKGGANRAKSTTKKRRQEIASAGAKARWDKWRKDKDAEAPK